MNDGEPVVLTNIQVGTLTILPFGMRTSHVSLNTALLRKFSPIIDLLYPQQCLSLRLALAIATVYSASPSSMNRPALAVEV